MRVLSGQDANYLFMMARYPHLQGMYFLKLSDRAKEVWFEIENNDELLKRWGWRLVD